MKKVMSYESRVIRRRTAIAAFMLMILFVPSCATKSEKPLETAKVTRGSIVASIPATGVVEPRNRVALKAPVAGRVDDVLVQEGDNVKKGQILAWTSSADRAALIDAAREKGKKELAYWQSVYKPAPLVAPLNGFIIQRAVEPGQSVTEADPILVMADELIVKAQVDETDLANISLNQKVSIVLDSYPGQQIAGYVEHIAYDSQLINNVNIYEVDVVANMIPAYLRSGMSATVNFSLNQRNNVLLLPLKAVKKQNSTSYVFIKNDKGVIQALQVKTGLETNDQIEIVSGIAEGKQVIIPTAKIISDTLQRNQGPRMGLPGMQRR